MGTRHETNLAIHPGEFLREELEARDLSQAAFARQIGRAAEAVNLICRERRGISAEMAIAIEGALGISAQTWLNFQQRYDLTLARQEVAKREMVAKT